MTFPVIASVATSSQTTNTTTHTVSMPSGVAAGDLLVMALAFDARPSVTGTIPDNWTQVISTASGNDAVTLRVYRKVATGSEGSTQSIDTSVGQTSAHRVWRITGSSVGTVLESALAQGPTAGTSADPPSLNPTNWDVEDTLWITLASNDQGTVGPSSYPTNYGNTGQTNAGDSADGCTLSWGTRENAAASEDPSAFTLSGSTDWATATLAIRPAAPVEFVAAGAKSAGSATATSIAYPSGISAGRMVLCGRSGWRSDITMADEAGWTNTAELGGGTGTSIDNHTTKIRVDRKELAGSESGSVTFDQSGSTNPGCLGIMLNYAKTAGQTWDVATSTGDDASHGANRSVTGSSSIALAVGDVVVAFVATDTDTNLASFGSPAITASGITFGTTTRRSPASGGVNTGDDGNIEVFDAVVTAGSGTAAPALSFNTTTSQCGPVAFVRLRSASSAVTGTVAVTQAADTSSATGQLGYSATSTATQADQSSSASGTATDPPSGSAAVTQADQTSTTSGQLGYSATASPAQAAQTSTATGQLIYTGTAAPAHADQSATASGNVVAFVGTVAATQLDSSAGTGQLGYSGTASATQANQTSSATGVLEFSGTGNVTQSDQTSTASGTATDPPSGSAAASQAAQTASASGQLGYSAAAAVTQANQTSSTAGQLGYTGTAAVTHAAQTSAGSGQLGYGGSSAAAQAGDTSSAAGQLGYTATAAVTQAADTSSGSGTASGLGIEGTAAVTQAGQTSTTSGTLGYSGTSAAAQTNQTSGAAGTLGYSGSGSAAADTQTAAAAGQLVYTATAAATQAAHTGSATGQLGSVGTAAITSASSTSAASGQLRYAGSGAATQAAQTAAGSGTSLLINLTGSAAAQQQDHTAGASGLLPVPVAAVFTETSRPTYQEPRRPTYREPGRATYREPVAATFEE